MYTIKALAKMYGLSPKQARDRVTALKPLIDAYTHDGKENATRYTEQGRAMLDRLLQVERENSVTIKAAGDQVKEEFQSHVPGSNGQVDEDLLDRIQELETELEEQSETYEKRLADLQRTISKHDGRLAEVEEQVQYMLEAPKEETGSQEAQTDGRHADQGRMGIDSTAERNAHDADGHTSEHGSPAQDVPVEVAVDGNLPRWRQALANVPQLISRMFS